MSASALVAGVVAVLLATLAGEGGAEPTALVVWHGLVAGLLAVWLLARPGVTARLDRGLLAGFSLFAATALAGFALAPGTFSALLVLVEIAAWAALAWLAAQAGPRLLPSLGRALLVAAVLEATLAIGQRLVHGATRPAGTFLNPNHLGGWLVAAFWLGAGAWSLPAATTRRAVVLRALACLPLFVALALTGSRGALIALAAGACVFWLLRRPELSRAQRRWLATAGAGVALLAAIVVLWRLSDRDPFRYHRLRIWRASIALARDRPLLGSGPGQFATLARSYQFDDGQPPLRHDRVFTTPHSDLLRLPCEFGLVGTLALALVLGAAGCDLRRRWRRTPPSRVQCAALAALAGLAAQAMVDDLSRRPALYALAAAIAGSLLAGRPRRVRRPGRSLPVALGLASCVVALYGIADLGPYRAWRLAEPLPRGRLGDPARARLDAALRVNPLHPDLWLRRAEDRAGDPRTLLLDDYVAAREAAEHAVRLNPALATGHRHLARVEARACQELRFERQTCGRAVRAYERAEARAPFDPFIPLERAAFLLDSGDPAGAAGAAQAVLDLEPEAVAPRLLLAGALLSIPEAEPATLARARTLLAEARARAARWAAVAGEGPYARELLRLDPRVLERIERVLAARDGLAP